MACYKCKMCSAPLDVEKGKTVVTCSFCGSKQTVANADDERKENLFNRANILRTNCDFDKALSSYQTILSIFPNEPEAYWGLTLCKYGIEYVDDLKTKKKVPTIHRMSFESILKDQDYLNTLAYADVVAREQYEVEAKEIANIQKNILSISQKEKPFDIFICYKETDEVGKRTPDSVMAQEIYSNLTEKGYKVFFSRITLENKLGNMFEPYIFAALNSAKIMLVIGTKKEYFNAMRVKNEWSRFISLMQTRPDHYLIPCFRDMNAYDMPEEFLAFQAQDLSKLGFMQDLNRGIDKIMGRNEPIEKKETKIIQTNVNIDALLTRAEILISDKSYSKADELLETVLNNDPINSQAYLLKLVIELQGTSIESIKETSNPLESYNNFNRAYEFGNEEQKEKLDSILMATQKRVKDKLNEEIYNKAMKFKAAESWEEARNGFKEIIDYKDSANQIKEINETVYQRAMRQKNAKNYNGAIVYFNQVIDYLDSKEQVQLLTNESIYQSSLVNEEINNYFQAKKMKEACDKLETIRGYKDVDERLDRYHNILDTFYEDEKKRQEINKIKKGKIAKKVKRYSIFASIGAFILTSILLFTFLYLVPMGRQRNIEIDIDNRFYDEAISLIEEDINYGDNDNLYFMCKAGQEFQRGNYERGIDLICQIDGTVDVEYYAFGGESQRDSETIRKINKAYINNDCSYKGHTFQGWVLDDYQIYSSKHYAKLYLRASYQPILYSITYDLDGGRCETRLPDQYYVNTSFVIPNPTKYGYTFIGWEGSDLDEPTKNLVIQFGTVGNKHYRALWKANEYKIYLDYNGGTGYQDVVNVSYESYFTLPWATREGYNFDGWKDEWNITYSGGYYQLTSDLYLKAAWSLHDYTINYVLDGGTNSSENPSTYTINSSFKFHDPIKNGFTFFGWQDSNKNFITEIVSGTKGDLTLYAKRNDGNVYTITFNPNGGEVSPNSINVQYSQQYDLPIPTRTGYNFVSWYLGETQIEKSGTWEIDEDVELYANWSLATYSIKYVLNGGINSSKNPTEYTINEEHSLYDARKTGYTFLGWFDQNNNRLTEIKKGTYGKLILTAHWNDGNTYVVTLNPFGGECTEDSINVQFDHNYNLPIPTRLGYTFDGWFYGDSIIPNNGIWKKFNFNVSLEAHWSIINYSITYNLNGGKEKSPNRTTYTVHDFFAFHDPFKTGYTFLGWFDENNNKIIAITPGRTGNLTLDAHWNDGNVYTITLNANGGTCSESSIVLQFGHEYSLPIPTRLGYSFEGWYQGITKISNSDKEWCGVGDTTLVAKWSIITYSITYVLDGGKNSDSNPSSYTVEDSITFSDPFKIGYIFNGWFDAEGNQITSLNGEIANDLVLIADWGLNNEWAITHGLIPSLSEDGKTMTYGLYPNKKISDETLIGNVQEFGTRINGMIFYEDELYVYCKSSTFYGGTFTFEDGTSAEDNHGYYFLCKPIVWNILNNENGKYYLVSNDLIDMHRFGEHYYGLENGVRANNYEHSEIREWLNSSFYDKAFWLNDTYIETMNVDNSPSSTGNSNNPYCCENTEDKVALLSYIEAISLKTDFRMTKATDRAIANGVSENYYWTRSPFYKDKIDSGSDISAINYSGGTNYSTANNYYGVRPVITLNMQ